MPDYEITIEGLDTWLKITDPDRFVREVDRGVQQAIEMLRDETKKMPPVSANTTGYGQPGIPVDTGRLRQSIQKRKIALMAAEIFAPVQYAEFVHQGTSKMPARPFFEWVWADFGGKEKTEDILKEALERLVNP